MPIGVKQIRQAVRNQKYRYSVHALEEMDNDAIADADVVYAIMNGAVVVTLTEDPRGTRFVVRGPALDMERESRLCVASSPSTLRIITVYAIQE